MTIHPKTNEPLVLSGRDVTAVLGPTNTGKTHLAIERMVAHESGLIGLPLRLLAREVYGRVCEKVGAHKVALITGEEKIVPPGAKYSVCTVEAMPRETDAAFVAIDEVQLAGDFERGHIFTDRLLHLRGRQETLLLGAATMRSMARCVLPVLVGPSTAVTSRPERTSGSFDLGWMVIGSERGLSGSAFRSQSGRRRSRAASPRPCRPNSARQAVRSSPRR